MKNKIAKIMISVIIIGVVFISQSGIALEPKIVIKTVDSVSKAFDVKHARNYPKRMR